MYRETIRKRDKTEKNRPEEVQVIKKEKKKETPDIQQCPSNADVYRFRL
jgi:hypothetical protein